MFILRNRCAKEYFSLFPGQKKYSWFFQPILFLQRYCESNSWLATLEVFGNIFKTISRKIAKTHRFQNFAAHRGLGLVSLNTVTPLIETW